MCANLVFCALACAAAFFTLVCALCAGRLLIPSLAVLCALCVTITALSTADWVMRKRYCLPALGALGIEAFFWSPAKRRTVRVSTASRGSCSQNGIPAIRNHLQWERFCKTHGIDMESAAQTAQARGSWGVYLQDDTAPRRACRIVPVNNGYAVFICPYMPMNNDAGGLNQQAGRIVDQDRMFSILCHELRAPLSSILALTDGITHSKNADAMHAGVINIRRCATHLLNFANNILDGRSLRYTQGPAAQERFLPGDLIAESMAIIRPLAQRKQQSMVCALHDDHPRYYYGAATLLRQAMVNLLSNAVKYTGANGSIALEASILCRESEYIMVTKVQDNGIGMPQEYVKNIFTAFSRADNARQASGFGLGLALTKELLEDAGGSIKVESALGQGSVFTVCIPIKPGESVANQPTPAQSARILIVGPRAHRMESVLCAFADWDIPHQYVATAQEAHAAMEQALAQGNPFEAVACFGDIPLFTLRSYISIAYSQLPHDPLLMLDIDNPQAGLARPDVRIQAPITRAALRHALARLANLRHALADDEVRLNGFHILLADDNDISRDILRDLIDYSGGACVNCRDGHEAYNRFISCVPGHYTAIVLDFNMPGMNGIQCTQAIRQSAHPEAERIPIIGLTASPDIALHFEALHSGMNQCLVKPISITKLAQALRRQGAFHDSID